MATRRSFWALAVCLLVACGGREAGFRDRFWGMTVDIPEGFSVSESDFSQVEGEGRVLLVLEGDGCNLSIVDEQLARRSGITTSEGYAAAAMNALGASGAQTERVTLGGREFVRMCGFSLSEELEQELYMRVERGRALIVTASFTDSAAVLPALDGIRFE